MVPARSADAVSASGPASRRAATVMRSCAHGSDQRVAAAISDRSASSMLMAGASGIS